MPSDATILAIQAINAGVGLNAPDTFPPTITATDLPLALTFMGPTDAGKFGVTTYVSMIFIASVSQGIAPEIVFNDGNSFLKALRAAYLPLGNINGCAIQKGGNPSRHGGFGSPLGMLATVKYAGIELYGFEFHVPLVGVS